MENDDHPKKVLAHTIGEKLDDLSVADFDERIELLRAEIDRLQAAKLIKQAALDQAGSVFKH